MMLARLPYRVQIPLGLALAVVIAASMVTVVSARISANAVRQDTLATVDRAAALLSDQARPLLAADDTWQIFALLRSTAALLPGAASGQARAALLDSAGRVFAASVPSRIPTGRTWLGQEVAGAHLPAAQTLGQREVLERKGGAITLIDPVRSEDGQVLGFVYIEVDAPVFAPRWASLAQPALIGAGLAVALLVPIGWWLGRSMTAPVARIAHTIARIGHADLSRLSAELPRTPDPELGRISEAVAGWIGEMQVREEAEARALAAERMAAVGRMTAAVAHEINNPLAGLLTAAQTLRVHGESEEARTRTLDLLERGLNQIRATVAALLPQARIEDRALDPGDVDDVAQLVAPAAARYQVRLATEVEVESALRVPSAVVRQVMLNLLLNAVKAAGDQGCVHARLEADAEVVRVIVRNGGKRLSSAALEARIVAEGTNDPRGFGLWVCREIATQYAGGFASDEACADGTQLVFWMPNRERQEEAAADRG
jgi:signal transduction histidine kinase